MPIRICVGYNNDDLLQAQWDVNRVIEQSLYRNWPAFQARVTLREALSGVSHTTLSPIEWIQRFTENLVEIVATFQVEQASVRNSDLLTTQAERDRLQRIVDEFQQHPLQEQVTAWKNWSYQAQTQMSQQAERIKALEGALERARTAHAAETQHLEGVVRALQDKIAALNRLLVEQQDALNRQ